MKWRAHSYSSTSANTHWVNKITHSSVQFCSLSHRHWAEVINVETDRGDTRPLAACELQRHTRLSVKLTHKWWSLWILGVKHTHLMPNTGLRGWGHYEELQLTAGGWLYTELITTGTRIYICGFLWIYFSSAKLIFSFRGKIGQQSCSVSQQRWVSGTWRWC